MFKVLVDTSVFGFALETSVDEKVVSTKNFLGIPVIVTWNLKHMANVAVKRAINSVNILLGYSTVDIVTPMELTEEP